MERLSTKPSSALKGQMNETLFERLQTFWINCNTLAKTNRETIFNAKTGLTDASFIQIWTSWRLWLRRSSSPILTCSRLCPIVLGEAAWNAIFWQVINRSTSGEHRPPLRSTLSTNIQAHLSSIIIKVANDTQRVALVERKLLRNCLTETAKKFFCAKMEIEKCLGWSCYAK